MSYLSSKQCGGHVESCATSGKQFVTLFRRICSPDRVFEGIVAVVIDYDSQTIALLPFLVIEKMDTQKMMQFFFFFVFGKTGAS